MGGHIADQEDERCPAVTCSSFCSGIIEVIVSFCYTKLSLLLSDLCGFFFFLVTSVLRLENRTSLFSEQSQQQQQGLRTTGKDNYTSTAVRETNQFEL